MDSESQLPIGGYMQSKDGIGRDAVVATRSFF